MISKEDAREIRHCISYLFGIAFPKVGTPGWCANVDYYRSVMDLVNSITEPEKINIKTAEWMPEDAAYLVGKDKEHSYILKNMGKVTGEVDIENNKILFTKDATYQEKQPEPEKAIEQITGENEVVEDLKERIAEKKPEKIEPLEDILEPDQKHDKTPEYEITRGLKKINEIIKNINDRL